jgi:hypothetical protein
MLSRIDLNDQEVRLMEEALSALENKTGVAGRLLNFHPHVASNYQADAIMELMIAGKAQRFVAECKNNVDRKSTISLVHQKFEELEEPGILIAPYISREMADYCASLGQQFIDTHGNAFIRTGGYIYVTGERQQAGWQGRQTRGAANPAALRIMFALLSNRELMNASYRQIVDAAGVSLGAVSATFSDLAERGYILDQKSARDRRFLEPGRLLEEWVINYPAVLRPKLNSQRFIAPDSAWWRDVSVESLEAVWGSEVAAGRITNYLKPETQMLYVEPMFKRDCIKELVTRFRLRPDPKGPVEILDKFWNFPSAQTELAPPLLVYADLMATLDPRNREVAQMMLKEIHDSV